MSFKREVLEKLNKIEDKVTLHTVQLEVNNVVLKEHHKRSTLLEEQFKPVEKHVMLMNTIAKVIVAAGAAIATGASIYNYLVR